MPRLIGAAPCLIAVVALTLSATAASAAPRTGRRINIDLVDADIRNVLRLFADIADVNVVFGEEVTGRITVRLRRVRWDRALSAILRTRGLGLQREGNVFRVARRATLARERAARLADRRRCLDDGPLHTRMIRPAHARAEDLAPLLRAQLRSRRGAVAVDRRTNAVIIRDVRCR
jgi:type IV pilus assembly protein PilQ